MAGSMTVLAADAPAPTIGVVDMDKISFTIISSKTN